MKLTNKIEITNEDNMELMARYPDNYFDLAIVDPPYGIGRSESMLNGSSYKGTNGWKKHLKKTWDNEIPSKKYFDELFRISQNQIIWGANYFVEYLKKGSMGWVFWDKGQNIKMSDGELAFTSFNKAMRRIVINRCEIKKDGSIHSTQKPVKLYEFLLMNYAKEGDKILDTHLGSGSIAIACHNLGFELTACELDEDYFDSAIKRIENHISQQRLF